MSEIITMSSKGQIVVPKSLREQLGLDAGNTFIMVGKDDTLILKKINLPTAKEMWGTVQKWGLEEAKKKGWKEKDLMKKIHESRGLQK